jgi:regulator of sigma E protease
VSTLFGFVIVLGVLIFFHELGHFLCARAFGVGVEKFSLGFGPRLAAKTVGRTEYRISAIPLGGYVKLVGESPDAEVEPADVDESFSHKSVYKRMLIVASGPFFNFFLALVIFFGVFSISGVIVMEPVLGEIRPESPAEEAGLEPGDRVTAVDGAPISTWTEMAEKITRSQGSDIWLTIHRKGTTFDVRITPEKASMENLFGETVERYVVGVSADGSVVTERLNPAAALVESVHRTYMIIELTVVSVGKLITGSIPADNLGGPILIAQMAGEQVRQGLISLLFFIAIVSINLGILNLLPVPVLDGGHLLFFAIEAVRGKPVSIPMREKAQQVGLLLLLMLMIFVFYNDIMRFF